MSWLKLTEWHQRNVTLIHLLFVLYTKDRCDELKKVYWTIFSGSNPFGKTLETFSLRQTNFEHKMSRIIHLAYSPSAHIVSLNVSQESRVFRSFSKTFISLITFIKRITIVFENDCFFKNDKRPFLYDCFLKTIVLEN